MSKPSSCLAALLGVAFVGPDVIPPGYHGVDHKFVVTGLDRLPDHQLVAVGHWHTPPGAAAETGHPRIHSLSVIREGEPFWIYKFAVGRIYAVPQGTPVSARGGETAWLEQAVPADLELGTVSTLPLRDPVHQIRTAFRVIGLEAGKLVLEPLGETYRDAAGNTLTAGPGRGSSKPTLPTALLLGLPVLGVVGLVLLRVRRGSAGAA